jgi:hypothetical protein
MSAPPQHVPDSCAIDAAAAATVAPASTAALVPGTDLEAGPLQHITLSGMGCCCCCVQLVFPLLSPPASLALRRICLTAAIAALQSRPDGRAVSAIKHGNMLPMQMQLLHCSRHTPSPATQAFQTRPTSHFWMTLQVAAALHAGWCKLGGSMHHLPMLFTHNSLKRR